MQKTNKELAYLHELFVATDWGERFAELIDQHVKLPKEGKVLYVGSGTEVMQLRYKNRLAIHLSLYALMKTRRISS